MRRQFENEANPTFHTRKRPRVRSSTISKANGDMGDRDPGTGRTRGLGRRRNMDGFFVSSEVPRHETSGKRLVFASRPDAKCWPAASESSHSDRHHDGGASDIHADFHAGLDAGFHSKITATPFDP